MGDIDIRKHFMGKGAWNTINNTIIFGVYAMLFVVGTVAPNSFWIVIIVISFILLIYGNFYQHKMKEIIENRKGTRSVEGWTTHGHKIGEEHCFEPSRFEVKDKLSSVVLEDIQKFIDIQTQHSEDLKTKTGLDRFRQKQIPYKETVEKEKLSNEERIKLDKEEKEEYNEFMEEYDNMKIEEQLMEEEKEEEEPTDE